MARDCAQAWDPTPPVVSADIRTDVDGSSVSDSSTIMAVEDDVPDPDPVSITEPPADLPSDPVKPVPAADPIELVNPAKVSDKSPVPVVKVTDKSTDVPMPVADPVSDKSSEVPRPVSSTPRASKSPRSPVTAKIFCARLSKNFQPLSFPDFGDISDKERDSKAKAHLRAQIKTIFTSKDMDVISSDLRKWSESDLGEISNLFCKMLSVRDYLVDFVSGVVKSYWNSAKSKHK